MSEGYYYRVTMVTDYLAVTATVFLDLDENTGNLSAEAWRRAVIEADDTFNYELASNISKRANEITVTLLLDDEEIELEEEAVNA